MKPLTNFFKTNDNCDVRKEPSSEHSQLISTITVLQVDPNINSHEPETRIGICKKFNLKTNNSIKFCNFVLAIDNNAPDLSSRTDNISLEVNEIEAIVHNVQNPINRIGNIPVQVDVNVNSVGREY